MLKFDLVIKQCQDELNSLRRQNQEITIENQEKEMKANKLFINYKTNWTQKIKV